jgi:hypothetical protein
VAAASGLSHTLPRLIELFVVTMQTLTASSLRKCEGAVAVAVFLRVGLMGVVCERARSLLCSDKGGQGVEG